MSMSLFLLPLLLLFYVKMSLKRLIMLVVYQKFDKNSYPTQMKTTEKKCESNDQKQ